LDDLKALRTFVALAQRRSFAKVADAERTHPSSISRKIRDLESDLGVRLFQRTTRSVALTPAGQILLDRVSVLLAGLDQAREEATAPRAAAKGHIKVAAPVSFARMHLGALFARFHEKFPDIRITLLSSNNFDDLIADGFDVAIRISESRDSSFVARNLLNVERVVCASPAYLAGAGKPARARDLKEHNCLIPNYRNAGARWYYRRAGVSGAVAVSGSLRSNQGDVIVEAAKSGLGIALLPRWLIRSELNSGDLVRLFPEVGWSPSKKSQPVLQLIYPHRRAISRVAQLFVEFAAAELRHAVS
jgi:DNA-binding transcriptional LysR family regulator